MEAVGNMQYWIDGFEQELQVRFNNKGLKVHVSDQSKISENDVISIVCSVSDVTKHQLLHHKKGSRRLSDARMVLAYFLTKIFSLHPKQVGDIINRDRTSVIYAIDTINDRLETKDHSVTTLIENVNQALIERSVSITAT